MKKTYQSPEIEIVRFDTEAVLEGILVQSGLNQDLEGVGGFNPFEDEGDAVSVSPFN